MTSSRPCFYCQAVDHSEDDCAKKRKDRGKTFVSPHEYAECDPRCPREDWHCEYHCGFPKDDEIHQVAEVASRHEFVQCRWYECLGAIHCAEHCGCDPDDEIHQVAEVA